MKKLLLIAALIVALLVPFSGWAAELNNITSAGVDGNLVFYDKSGNIIMTLDAANRKLSFPSGSLLETLGTTIKIGNITYTVPTNDGTGTQYLATDGSGVLSWAGGASTAWDDLGAADAAKTHAFTTFAQTFTSTKTDGDMFNIQGLGAFGDVSVVRIEQKTGLATDGTVLEVVSADTDVDALLVTANSSNAIQVTGAGNLNLIGLTGSIDYTDFDVSADGAVTLAGDDGGTMITLTPSAAAIGIDASNATITTALTVGANAILGTTGIIDYTNFDVDASGNIVSLGNVTAVNGTFSGNVLVTGTFLQDALRAATAAATTITLNGTTTGGVTIGGISTGAINLGGGATLVNLPATVDMTISGGSLAVTDTANTDMVTFTNNTMTTADLLTLTAGGTRTSNNVIAITDSATTASTIGITANAATSANVVSITADALDTGTMLLLDSDGIPAATYYIRAFDGAANDFTVGADGAVTIAGAASTNVLTVTAGDVQIDDGLIEIDTDEDDMSYIKRNQGATSKPAFKVWEAAAAADSPAVLIDQDATTAASYGLQIDSAGGTIAHMNIGAAAGDGILATVPASYTGQLIKSNLLAWLGTSGEGGIVDIVTTAAATQEVGQGIRLNYLGTGTAGTAVTGKGLFVHADAGAIAGESLVYLDTLFNTAIHINNNGVSADGIKFDFANAYTGQGIVADLGPWVGTVSEGFIHIESDAAGTDVAGQILRINLRDSLVDTTAISGKAIYAKEVSPFKSGTYLVHFESTSNGSLFLSGPVSLQAAAPLVGASPLVLEGATADAFEVTIAVTDPKLDSTLTLPAGTVSGNIASYIVGGTTTDSESEAATETIGESTVAIPALHAAAGQTYVWEMAGTKTGANDTFACQLDLTGTNSLTLTSPDAAAGDWVCRITLQLTGAATQKIYGELLINGKSPVVDYAAGAVDLAGAVNVGLELVLANAADEVAAESVIVRYNE